MFSEALTVWSVVGMTVLALVLFFVFGAAMKFLKIVEENELQKALHDVALPRDLPSESIPMVQAANKSNIAKNYQTLLTQVRSSVLRVFFGQAWRAILLSFIVWGVLTTWFIYHDTYLLSFLAYFWGIVSVCVSLFIIAHLSVPAITRFIVQAKYGVGEGFVSGWISAVSISSAIISTVLLFYVFFEPVNKWIYMSKDDNQSWWSGSFKQWTDKNFGVDPEKTQEEQLKHLYYAALSYGVAVITTGVFLRDVPKIIGAGLTVGHDVVSRFAVQRNDNDDTTATLRKGKLVGGVLQDLQVAADAVCVTAAFLAVLPLLTAYTSLSVFHQYAVFYFPLYVLAAGALTSYLSSGVVFLQKGFRRHGEDAVDASAKRTGIKTFTSRQVRMQLLTVNSIMLGALVGVAFFCLPQTPFSVGDNILSPFYFDEVTFGGVVWCLEIGLITQTIKLILSEYFTSHRFGPARDAASGARYDVALGLIQLTSNSQIAHFLLMLVLAAGVMISFILGGFYGIAMCALGMISNHVALMACMFFGQVCVRAEQLSLYARDFAYDAVAKITHMGYAARNYRIFLPIVNCGGTFMLNMVCIGLVSCICKIENVVIWDAFVIFGFILGSGLAYFLNGNSVLGVKSVIDSIIEDERKSGLAQNDENNVFFGADPWRFIQPRVNKAFWRVFFNILICIASILVIGAIFGASGLIGYILGLNLVGLHITYLSILKYYSAQNARNYNEQSESQGLVNDQIIAQRLTIGEGGDKGTLQINSAHTALDSNALIIYLLFNMIFVLHGVRVMSGWGSVGEKFRIGAKDVSEKSGAFVSDSVLKIENSILGNDTIAARDAGLQQEQQIAEQQSSQEKKAHLEYLKQDQAEQQQQVDSLEQQLQGTNTDEASQIAALFFF